eukprot:6196135-Pleurochrysis_carterae.AAC.3
MQARTRQLLNPYKTQSSLAGERAVQRALHATAMCQKQRAIALLPSRAAHTSRTEASTKPAQPDPCHQFSVQGRRCLAAWADDARFSDLNATKGAV